MWCRHCMHETKESTCELCHEPTQDEVSVGIYWCKNCTSPVILEKTAIKTCPLCTEMVEYLASDLRPVFPEERLLIEILVAEPFAFAQNTVWAADNRFYVDGKSHAISIDKFQKLDVIHIKNALDKHSKNNTYDVFNETISRFVAVNQERLRSISSEAMDFVRDTSKSYPNEHIVVSFSGGKDSTVTADIVTRGLSDPSLVHIFGDTTLEFPMTMEYASRFRKNNPKTIFKTAKNKEQDFLSVCADIGPPARMLRWCCSMFKTGPITRVLNNLYRNTSILTFYGIRKCESVSRSKYNRIENDAEAFKIQKQTVASPIFLWQDIDIWLYILGENIDFNDAYRLGYDRVGCWCCPNNNKRAIFLSRIYMPEEAEVWRNFLVDFAKKIGKPDPEVYVDEGKWKARQGGNGVKAAEDVKIRFTNCTAEEYAKIYKLNKEMDDTFLNMMVVFGIVSKELGRKLLKETLVLDKKTNVPIISIQPFSEMGLILP